MSLVLLKAHWWLLPDSNTSHGIRWKPFYRLLHHIFTSLSKVILRVNNNDYKEQRTRYFRFLRSATSYNKYEKRNLLYDSSVHRYRGVLDLITWWVRTKRIGADLVLQFYCANTFEPIELGRGIKHWRHFTTRIYHVDKGMYTLVGRKGPIWINHMRLLRFDQTTRALMSMWPPDRYKYNVYK